MEYNNQLTKKKLLIVDDNPAAIDVLGNTLPKEYKRQIALSGERALEILAVSTDLPDLILLDVNKNVCPANGGLLLNLPLPNSLYRLWKCLCVAYWYSR